MWALNFKIKVKNNQLSFLKYCTFLTISYFDTKGVTLFNSVYNILLQHSILTLRHFPKNVHHPSLFVFLGYKFIIFIILPVLEGFLQAHLLSFLTGEIGKGSRVEWFKSKTQNETFFKCFFLN